MNTNGFPGLPDDVRRLLEELGGGGKFKVVNLGQLEAGELPPQIAQMLGGMGRGPRRESRGGEIEEERIEEFYEAGYRSCPSCGKPTCPITLKLNQLAEKKMFSAVEIAVEKALIAEKKTNEERRIYFSPQKRLARWYKKSWLSYVPDFLEGWQKYGQFIYLYKPSSKGKKDGAKVRRFFSTLPFRLSRWFQEVMHYVPAFYYGFRDAKCTKCPTLATCQGLYAGSRHGSQMRGFINRRTAWVKANGTKARVWWGKTRIYAFLHKKAK